MVLADSGPFTVNANLAEALLSHGNVGPFGLQQPDAEGRGANRAGLTVGNSLSF